MLNDIFLKLQNKQFYDYRDHPIKLTEQHRITGIITDENRRIKLGERLIDFDDVLLVKTFTSSGSFSCRVVHYEKLALHYIPFDITISCYHYDETSDIYYLNMLFYRGDNLDIISKDTSVSGGFGEANPIVFDSIIGSFVFVISGVLNVGSKIVMTMIAYGTESIIVDSLNVFVGKGDYNALYYNTASNSIIINDIPYPQSAGDFDLLVRYTGIGSVICAEDLNDIVRIIKYYNLLPKFDVVKVNNNDIKVFIRGEYYYLGNRVEKYDDQTFQIEDEILFGFWNALVGYLDIPNNMFGVTRISTGMNYHELINELPNFIIENPDLWVPIFIMIFDDHKNIFEYSYVNNRTGAGGSGITVLKYAVDFSNVTNMSIPLLNSKPPVVTVYDENGHVIIPDDVHWVGNVVELNFYEPQSGVVSMVS